MLSTTKLFLFQNIHEHTDLNEEWSSLIKTLKFFFVNVTSHFFPIIYFKSSLMYADFFSSVSVPQAEWAPTLVSQPHKGHLTYKLNSKISWQFSYISFSSFTFSGTPYWILLLFLPGYPCYFYLDVNEQQQALVLNVRDRYIPPKKIPLGKFHLENSSYGKFLLWKKTM